MSNRPLGAQISHMLKDRGVDTIFGIPGVHNQEMYRGIEEAGISHVLARHEQGAGFMADGYARATRRPGVAYVITGPGLCNIMTPMGQAYSDSVPVLVISSCLDETAARRGQLHQMLDQAGAARTVCDWSYEAKTAEAAYGLIDRALSEFATERPRTKHIQVPIAALEGAAKPAGRASVARGQKHPAEADLTALASALNAATKPLIVLGGGAIGGAEAWCQVAAQSGAATFSTYAACGMVPDGAALDFGTYLARPESAQIIGQADLVIVVGSELSENDIWREDLGHTAPLWRIDIDPEVLTDAQAADHAILADAALVGAALARQDLSAANGWDAAQIAEAKSRWKAETDSERPGIVRICDELSAAMPEDLMVFSDMTQFAYVAKEVWNMPRAGHWHHPNGFGTLGYALPAAIGGAVARRGKPTLCIAGDYGFQYTVQELGTAVELGLSLPITLWDNGKLKEIEDSMVRAQIAPNSVIAHNPDFCALAEAYGAASRHPASIEELVENVNQAFDADGPTLIYVTPQIT